MLNVLNLNDINHLELAVFISNLIFKLMTTAKGQIINAYENFISVLSETARQFITVCIKRLITHQTQKFF